jgi:uncharacterized protein involved in exopolysaccharide biosynthesis/Mrp family chromosome partitioning ATPase
MIEPSPSAGSIASHAKKFGRVDRFAGITEEAADAESMAATGPAAMLGPLLRPDDAMSISELLGILRRRRMAIFVTIAVLTVLPTVYGLLLEPAYTAVASVMIAPRDSRIMDVGNLSSETVPDAATLETQGDILQSRALIMATMEDLHLFSDPEFQADTDSDADSASLVPPHALTEWLPESLQSWWKSVTAALGAAVDQSAPEIPAVSEEQQEREAAARVFAQNLDVTQSGKAYVLQASFTSTSPVKAAEIVNRLTDLYVERQLQDKLAATQKANLWLTDRLRTQQQEVLESERSAAELRSKYQFVAGKGASLTETRLDQLNRALIETRNAEAEKQAKLALISRLKAKGNGLDTIAEAIASPLISELHKQQAELIHQQADLAMTYGDNHPLAQVNREEMTRLSVRITDEIDRIVRGLQNELTVLATQEGTLEHDFEAAKAQSARDNEAGVHLEELEREAAAKRTLYETLLNRYQETRAQEGILQPDAQVISPAEIPSDPSTPSPIIFAAVGFTASTVFGCMLALLKEQLDNKLRSSRDVERSLQLPCLGLVPNVSVLERNQTLHGRLSSKPHSAYVQSVRALYIQLVAAVPPPKVILITSALPDEGKTSLAAGLAVCAAQAGGGKTLLIDLDLWRPRVAHDFRIAPESGVVDLLTTEGDRQQLLEQALIIDQATGIDILAAGKDHCRSKGRNRRRTGAPPGFLTPQSIYELLGELRKRYDHIVIDSPPLLGVSDGRILSMYADATIFVVRWGHTSRDAAMAAVRTLRDVSAGILGAVVTRVDMKKHAQNGQGDGLQFYENFRKYYAD